MLHVGSVNKNAGSGRPKINGSGSSFLVIIFIIIHFMDENSPMKMVFCVVLYVLEVVSYSFYKVT